MEGKIIHDTTEAHSAFYLAPNLLSGETFIGVVYNTAEIRPRKKSSRTKPAGWGLPGGSVEEKFLDDAMGAARRELEHEFGLRPAGGAFLNELFEKLQIAIEPFDGDNDDPPPIYFSYDKGQRPHLLIPTGFPPLGRSEDERTVKKDGRITGVVVRNGETATDLHWHLFTAKTQWEGTPVQEAFREADSRLGEPGSLLILPNDLFEGLNLEEAQPQTQADGSVKPPEIGAIALATPDYLRWLEELPFRERREELSEACFEALGDRGMAMGNFYISQLRRLIRGLDILGL